MQGAPVTTVDFDFLFRPTPRNLAKLKMLARRLGATILRPYYPASDLYRLVRDEDGLQVDFMGTIHGIRSFEGVRDRASTVAVGGAEIRVAAPRISSGASRPPGDRVMRLRSRSWRLPVSTPGKSPRSRRVRLAAVARESDRSLADLIRRWQSRPAPRAPVAGSGSRIPARLDRLHERRRRLDAHAMPQ